MWFSENYEPRFHTTKHIADTINLTTPNLQNVYLEEMTELCYANTSRTVWKQHYILPEQSYPQIVRLEEHG